MRSVEAWKRKQLKNLKFKAEYDALEEEFALARKQIAARKKAAAKKKPAIRTKKSPPSRGKVEAPKVLPAGDKSKKKTKKNPHHGSSFDSFLKEEGIFDQLTDTATKRVNWENVPKRFGSRSK